MTYKERVLQTYPKAAAQHYATRSGRGYWLVWSEGWDRSLRLAEGATKAEAWKNALGHMLLPSTCSLCDVKNGDCASMRKSVSCFANLIRLKEESNG